MGTIGWLALGGVFVYGWTLAKPDKIHGAAHRSVSDGVYTTAFRNNQIRTGTTYPQRLDTFGGLQDVVADQSAQHADEARRQYALRAIMRETQGHVTGNAIVRTDYRLL